MWVPSPDPVFGEQSLTAYRRALVSRLPRQDPPVPQGRYLDQGQWKKWWLPDTIHKPGRPCNGLILSGHLHLDDKMPAVSLWWAVMDPGLLIALAKPGKRSVAVLLNSVRYSLLFKSCACVSAPALSLQCIVSRDILDHYNCALFWPLLGHHEFSVWVPEVHKCIIIWDLLIVWELSINFL